MENTNRTSLSKLFIAIGGLLVANSLAFLVGDLAGATWDVGQPFLIGIGVVIGATIAPMLLGGLVARLVSLKSAKAVKWLSWGVLVFSVLGSPAGWLASGDLATGASLAAMHFFEGLAFFWALRPAKTKK